MPCLAHLQCSGCLQQCHSPTEIGTLRTSTALSQTHWPLTAKSGWQHASLGPTQRPPFIRAAQATADAPCLAEPPKRPRRVEQLLPAELHPSASPTPPAASKRLQDQLPNAPLVSLQDRAPPLRQHVYWRGSVTSREAVLGRRLLGSSGQASAASVLQGEMLSSKQITRWALITQPRKDRNGCKVPGMCCTHFARLHQP